VLAVGRSIATGSSQKGENLLPNRSEHGGWFFVLEARPPQVLLFGAETELLGVAAHSGLALGERLQVVEPADEEQVGDSLDYFQRIGDAARPK
jgi:hypothetical protein